MFHCWRQATTKSRGAQNIPGERYRKEGNVTDKNDYKSGRDPQAREIRELFLRGFGLLIYTNERKERLLRIK